MNDEQIVRAMVTAAGLTPSDDEIEQLTRLYPMFRASAEVVHKAGVERDDPPASVFDPAPEFADWG